LNERFLMKRLSRVVFAIVTLFFFATTASAIALSQEEQENETQSPMSLSPAEASSARWSFDDADDEELDEEDLTEQEKELTAWERFVQTYENAKILIKMGYKAKVRPLVHRHKKAIYGTAASLAAVLAMLYGVKKFKNNGKAAAGTGAQATAETAQNPA